MTMKQRIPILWGLAFVCTFCCLSTARAEGWFNPGMEGGVSVGEYDLNGDCLYYAKTADADTYLCPSAADEVTLTCGAADVWVCNASGCNLTGELGSVTSLDATTESTIEAAIDTLGDIASGSIAQGDDKSICRGADIDFCCEWDTDGTEGLLCTATDCDGIGTDCTAGHLYEDSGNLILDMPGIDSITNSSQKITIGAPSTSSHSLGANQMHCTGETEFDSTVYFDGAVFHATTMTINSRRQMCLGSNYDSCAVFETTVAPNVVMVGVPAQSNAWFFMQKADLGTDYMDAVPDDPIIGIGGSDNTDTTKQSRRSWNRLSLGGNGGGLGCINQTFAYDDFTDDGGVSGHLDLDEQIPIGAVIVGQIVIHSLTGFTGDATAALTVGDDGGVDVDRYHSAGTLNVVASAAAGVDCGAPSGTTWHVAAVTVRLVLTGAADFGNFSAGEATISICYWTP